MKKGIITNAVDWRSRKLQGSVKFQGLPLSIENERGSYRQGTDEHGNVWKSFMAMKYGYIRATLGVDGDCVDVYVGNNVFSNRVFIIHQNDPFTGKYDEDKVILGVGSSEEAKAKYLKQYDRPDYFGSMEEVDMVTFKKMLRGAKGIKLKKVSSKKRFSNTRTSHAKSAGNLTDTDTLIKKSKSSVSVELEGIQKAKREPIGMVSKDGKRKKIAEGKWIDIKKPLKLFDGLKLDSFEVSKLDEFLQDRQDQHEHIATRIKDKGVSSAMKRVYERQLIVIDRAEILVDAIKKGEVRFHDPNSEKGDSAVIHKSPREEWKWQLSYFDERGPFHHANGNNLKDILTEMERMGNFIPGKPSKGLLKSKYINKFWKNGQWHYTYDKNGSRRPRQMPSHAVHKNLGGTTGGVFLISMPNGERKVMKQSTSPKHIIEEYTANRVYKILGVSVPNVSLYSTEKGVTQIADFIEGTPMGDLESEERYDAIESLKRGFVADALLGNWDVLGMNEDNILWDGSRAWRIDNGGAMRYCAQGAAKGESFAGTVGEIDSMRNTDRGAGKVFHGVTEAEIVSQINNIKAHKQAILQAVADPKLRGIMEARINSLATIAKSMNWVPDLTLLKSDSGVWHLYEHGMLTQFYWFHDLEKAIKTKSYYSPEEVKARGMRWVTIRGARVLLQGTADGGYVVVGGAGGKLNHLKIDKILSKEDYSKKRGKVEAKRTEDLRKLSKEEMAEHVAKRREEVKAKKVVRAAYTEKVTEVLGITQEEIRSEISAKQMDELANKARIMVEGRASVKTLNQKAIDKEIEKQTEKELNKAVHKKIKDTERQALETLMKDYMPDDPNAKPELKKLLDHDKAVEILAARKEFRKQIKAIGKDAADIPTDLKVGDVFAGATDKDVKAIEQEVRDQIETQKNIRLYDTMNAQSLSIQKHVDEGAISALNGLIGDLYGSGATFSSDTVAQLGLEAVVRSVAIKIQKDGRGGAVKEALEEYAANEREKVVTTALTESEKRFKNAEQLRSLARDTDDAEAILSMASANGHALKQLTAGQRALGTAVGSLRAVAHLTAALDDPPADVVQIDIGKDLTRARKKAQKAGLIKGSYSIKTLKEGRAKRLVLELKKENVDNFFQHNEEMRKSENLIDKIKRHEMNDGYKPEGIQDSITFDDAQEAGLRFFKEQNNVILDFEAGIGKTGAAYGAMMEAIQNKGAKKILVVTPAKTRGDFKSQSKTFLTKDMQKMVLSSTENTTKADRHARHNAESGIHIVSQDSLRNDAATIKAAGYDMIVVDEIHEMTAGTGQAGRYKALTTLSDIPMKIVMSGTNIKNKKSELYRKINFVNPEHTLGSMVEFDKRYKGLNQGTGMFADAANEAFRKEMSPYMYTQKNALDIENKVTTERVSMTPSQRKAYAASERQYREDRDNKVPGASAKRDSRNYKIITDGHDIDNGKLNKLVDIMNTKHAGEKAVIHVSRPGVPVLEAMRTASSRLVKEFGDNAVGMIHGESSPGAVTELKRRFNNPDDPLRFIVGTKSLESGHNLQHGGSVTFHLDIPDSYSAFEQRNARVYRKKQDQDTSTYVLSGSNPYDMRGEDIMETKRKEQGILGNPREIESMDDFGFLGLLNKYETEVQGATA